MPLLHIWKLMNYGCIQFCGSSLKKPNFCYKTYPNADRPLERCVNGDGIKIFLNFVVFCSC